MNMKFYTLAALLKSCSGLLYSAYFALAVSALIYIFQNMPSHYTVFILMIIFILCLLQHYYAIRLKFDAALLDKLSMLEKDVSIEQATVSIDHALLYFGLISKNKSTVSWESRFKGCLALFKMQIALLTLQYLGLIMMIFINEIYRT